jgi:hypothetical protein
MAALPTRSVTGRQRHGFIQEEQLSPRARAQHLTVPTSEFESASDPAPNL